MIIATAKTDGTVDLVGYQGTTWEFTISVYSDVESTVPLDLTGYLPKGQYKKDYYQGSPALITFVCTVLPYDVTNNPYTNIVKVTALPAQSSAVSVLSGVYDIEVTKDAYTERILRGRMTIDPEVTRI